MSIEKEFGNREAESPIRSFTNRKRFEEAAQDVGGVKKQIVMLVTWGCHTPERQFTGDVAELIQKTKGERKIRIHELKSFTHAMDIAKKHLEKTGKYYSDRKQDALWKTEYFQNLRAYNDLLRIARKEDASVTIDLHYTPSATHAPVSVYNNSKPSKLESNPIVYVQTSSKEIFEEYLKIPGINVIFWEALVRTEPLKRIDRMRASLHGFEYIGTKTLNKELWGYRHVLLEGFVFHLPHKQGEKCEISREEYEKVVASAADTVIRIYDHFNSKMLKKEQQTKELKTSAGNVTLEPAENNSLKKLSKEFEMYDVKLQPVGSEERIRTGYISFAYYRVGIDEDKIYDMNARRALELLRDRLSKGEMIANITNFYPFEDSSKREKFEGRGIGTAILNELLEEFKSRGAVGVSCWTDKEGMRRRLEKAGFQEIGGNIYFKKL